jgi:hypothetical protein
MVRLIALLAAVLALSTPAAAQNPNAKKNGSPPAKNAPVQAATSTPATSESHALFAGSWLDDASLVTPGAAWVALSATDWTDGTTRQLDAPAASLIVGTTPRTNFGLVIPVYHASDVTGASATGIGQVYVYGKIALREPGLFKPGLAIAITPLLAATRIPTATGTSEQVGFAAPVSLEWRGRVVRVYGSAGYFSQGALFGSAAASVSAGRVMVTGIVGRTHLTSSTSNGVLVDAQDRTDWGLNAGISTTPRVMIFATVGRSHTISTDGRWIAGGIAFMIGG